MKRIFAAIVLFAMLMSVMNISCQDSHMPSPDDPVTVTMWHNYGGDMQKTMDALIDEFNNTVGREQGIVINVTAISSSAELNESLNMIANDDPGAADMPDICTAYPKVAIQFYNQDKIVDLNDYFTTEELDEYISPFIEEGYLDDGLYVLPLAKSTEVLYLNRTLFDEFANETGASYDKLATFEGIAELSQSYYEWTDSKTPDVSNDGKQFFTADSWFNVAQVGMRQLGDELIKNNALALSGANYEHIFDTVYNAAVYGGIAMYDGYSSDLSKTGDIVCSTGSSAGVLFYGNTITYPDSTVLEVEYDILPYPIFEDGDNIAIQRGGGLMVAKSTKAREYASVVFLKWLTSPAQNMRFIASTGYLPVTDRAFEEDIEEQIETIEDERIKTMLEVVLSMYENYEFFAPQTFEEFEDIESAYNDLFLTVMARERKNYIEGAVEPSSSRALDELQRQVY